MRKWGCGVRKVDLGIAGKARSREKLLGKEVRVFGDSMSQAWRENLDKSDRDAIERVHGIHCSLV